jgi:hypothetical protein
MIIEFEDAIVSNLRKRFEGSGIVIEPMVDDLASFDVLGARGCIIVKFGGLICTPQNAKQIDLTWNAMVLVGSKHFGREIDYGVYQLIEGVFFSLTGLRISIHDRMPILTLIPTVVRYAREQAGVWWHSVEFQAKNSILI